MQVEQHPGAISPPLCSSLSNKVTPRLLTLFCRFVRQSQGETQALEMWLEALPPFMIIAGMFMITGMGLRAIDRWEFEGKVRLLYLTAVRFINDGCFVL